MKKQKKEIPNESDLISQNGVDFFPKEFATTALLNGRLRKNKLQLKKLSQQGLKDSASVFQNALENLVRVNGDEEILFQQFQQAEPSNQVGTAELYSYYAEMRHRMIQQQITDSYARQRAPNIPE